MASLTSILATDIISSTRGVINANFDALNKQSINLYKSSVQSISTSVLAVDNHLVFNVGANEVWNFNARLWVSSPTAPDFKLTFTAPPGTTGGWTETLTVGEDVKAFGATGTETTSGVAAGENYTYGGTAIIGSVVGSVALAWAQNTDTASSVTSLLKGSALIATKLT